MTTDGLCEHGVQGCAYCATGVEIIVRGETISVDLCYPRMDDERVRAIEVGLSDVRAADQIRITYDFERDGWKIEQASIFEWEVDDAVCDRGWKEVAFIPAWSQEDPAKRLL